MSCLYCYSVLWRHPSPSFSELTMKKHWKNRGIDWLQLSAPILAWWRQPVAFIVALIPLYRAMCAVSYLRIATAIEMAKKYGIFVYCCLVCIWPCCPPGQYSAKTRPMAASSGIKCSPGPPPSVNVLGIAQVHHCGRQMGCIKGAFIRCQQFHHQPSHCILM